MESSTSMAETALKAVIGTLGGEIGYIGRKEKGNAIARTHDSLQSRVVQKREQHGEKE